MASLVLESYLWLMWIDLLMRVGNIQAVHSQIRRYATRTSLHGPRPESEVLCHAMDLACAFYLKRVLCLQRSAATVLLLKHYGWNAQLVIGVQTTPFKSHAWAELNGAVVSDKPYMREMYQVLELL